MSYHCPVKYCPVCYPEVTTKNDVSAKDMQLNALCIKYAEIQDELNNIYNYLEAGVSDDS